MTATMHQDKTQARLLAVYVRGGGYASGHGLHVWLSRALGVSQRACRKWAEQGFPAYLVPMLEFLEALEVDRWPDRWRVR